MQRILVDTAATLSAQFFVDGTGTDPTPDSATVTVTRADGTVLVDAQAATDAADGQFTYQLEAAENDRLDTLTAEWTSTNLGTITTVYEVAGGFLFSTAEARALKPLDSVSQYSTAAIHAMRTTVEQALEDECGVAFVPRYTLETLSGDGGTTLPLRWPKVRAIRSASVTLSGTTTALTETELGLLTFADWGGLSGYTWTRGFGNVTVGYEHGHDRPPEEIKRAALLLAKIWLTAQNRPIDDRAMTFNAAEGGTYSLAVPGRNGSAFGHPDIDVAVQRYSLRVGVA